MSVANGFYRKCQEASEDILGNIESTNKLDEGLFNEHLNNTHLKEGGKKYIRLYKEIAKKLMNLKIRRVIQ